MALFKTSMPDLTIGLAPRCEEPAGEAVLRLSCGVGVPLFIDSFFMPFESGVPLFLLLDGTLVVKSPAFDEAFELGRCCCC